MIAPLQDYHNDLLSRIVSGDVVSGNVINANNCFHDSGDRPFKTSRIDRAGRSMHLYTSDLVGALQDIPQHFTQAT